MQVVSNTNELFNSVTYRLGFVIVDPCDFWNFTGVTDVLLTHAHFDHIYGLNDLFDKSPGLTVHTNELGREMLLDSKKNLSHYHETPFEFKHPEFIHTVADHEEISLENGLTAKAIFTPGHNPSCITWLIDNCLFTGDAFIPGVKTITNLPGGNKRQATESIEIIKKLAIDRTIYPGHKIF